MRASAANDLIQECESDEHVLMHLMTRGDVERMMRCAFSDEGWAQFAENFEFDHDGDYDDILYWVHDQAECGEIDRTTMFVVAPERLT